MRRTRALSIASAAIVFALAPEAAIAGEYSVGNCGSDQLNFNTRAFADFATRGMKIRRACDPEGHGRRGLITSNVVRAGQVPRGAAAVVTMSAPAGTRFTRFTWAGTLRRRDCRYALQIWADAPDIDMIPIKNVRANQRCPRPKLAQAAYKPAETFNVSGATQIVQRVACVGDEKRKSCSARGANYVQTREAEVQIVDVTPPVASILSDTPLARGEWVGGSQPLNYDASDNVGVRSADVILAGKSGGSDERACAFAVPERTFAETVPCPNGASQISVNTIAQQEGTQELLVRTRDTAGNVGDSAAVSARIDNTAPGRVDVSVEGGEGWRNRNDFALAWQNPPEPDRAPIVAASYKLCTLSSGECIRGDHSGLDISRFAAPVRDPGEWTLSIWRRDAAGNASEQAASVPVTLRYDPEPPILGFEPASATDPTLVAASVTDKVSGLAGGGIEISAAGSGSWQALPTEVIDSRLIARIDDASLPAGPYQLRARAHDQAGNEASTDRRLDGEPMSITLPLRVPSTLRAGFERARVVRRVVRQHGKRRVIRRRVTVLKSAARIRAGHSADVVGRLVDRDGQGISGADIRVLSGSSISPEQVVQVLRTAGDGRFGYRAGAGTSRTLRFAFPGSPLVLPAERTLRVSVPARTSLRVNRKRVLNGDSVTFAGRLTTQPAPPQGKLVELQARLSDRWQTFRTARADATGQWAIRYRFKRTRGVQRFRFRARLPVEASYPFAAGGSRPLTVTVRGL